MGMKRLSVLALLALLTGCDGAETEPAPPQLPPSCAEHELALPDGSCIRPGVLPDGCGEGFVHDGAYGCEPILPAEPCPPGQMAVPGDDTCRSVMACGPGKWGDLPVDATTQYVDGAYSGGDSDGSENRPWPTIGQAVSAAAPGALIAVAAGSYPENLYISGKAVRLWGVCPEQVTIEGTGSAIGPCPLATVCIADRAHGTEVGGVGILGPGMGITLSGSQGVIVDRVWVHDTGTRGIGVESTLALTSIEIRGSLIEQSHEGGMIVSGSDAMVDRSVLRYGLPRIPDQRLGRGITIQRLCWQTSGGWQCAPTRASLVVTRSLVEQNHAAGIQVMSSDATIDSSVVRTTLPRASDQRYGMGVNVQYSCLETPAGPECDPATRASAHISRSLIEQNHRAGISVVASDAVLDDLVVRGNLPRALDQIGGRGMDVQLGCYDTPTGPICDRETRANVSVSRSLIEHNHEGGIGIHGSDGTVDLSVVRFSLPNASDQTRGRGINIQPSCPTRVQGERLCDPETRSWATVARSLIEHNREQGLVIMGSDATVDSSVVRSTLANAATNAFGDGITVLAFDASGAITNSLVADNARAGVASFGASTSVAGTHIRCAAFELNGEPYGGSDFEFVDGGGNSCGCPTADSACQLVSVGLEPPEPLGTSH